MTPFLDSRNPAERKKDSKITSVMTTTRETEFEKFKTMNKEIKTPQQVINEAREEFEKFGNAKLMDDDDISGIPFKDYGLFDDIKSLITSTLQAFLEAEIARLEGMKHKDFKNRLGNEMQKERQRFGEFYYNYAIDDQISHLKELKL